MARTRLNAINACLRGISLSPIVVDDDTDIDAATAGQVVDQISHEVQSRGWWFNKEHNWKLTVDPITGYIAAPPSALSIITTGQSRNAQLTIRGDKIYDLYNHTFDLTSRLVSYGSDIEYVEFSFITELPFTQLPPVARIAISYMSRQQFAQDMEVDEKRWKFQMGDALKAENALLREEARNKKRNSLTDNAITANFITRAGGRNSQSNIYSVFPKRES